MIKLQAPYPNLQTTTVLPDPALADTEAAQQSLNIMRAIDGTRYSYAKKPGLKKLVYHFTLSRLKAEELKAFIASYYRAKIRMTNHKGEVWLVWFTANPFEFADKGRDAVEIDLEMQGVKQ